MKKALAVAMAVLAIGLFIYSGFIAASDAQGAILYIFTLPIMAGLLTVGVVLAKDAAGVRKILYAEAIFLVLFVAAAFIPQLRFISDGVIGGISKSFEAITGQTPYVWSRSR